MSGVGIVMTRDDASPLLQRVKDAATAAGLSLVMARAIGIQVKDHLVALNAERHRYGTNYYARAARSVTARAAGGFAMVSVTHVGIRLRRYGTAGLPGGVLRPKSPRRFLTLPAAPEAYGTRAREFNDLQFGRAMNERGRIQYALIRRASTPISITRRKRKDGTVKTSVRPGELRDGGVVIFWLVRSVTQRADPTVLPTRAEMIAVGIAAAERRLQRLNDRNPNAGGPN